MGENALWVFSTKSEDLVRGTDIGSLSMCASSTLETGKEAKRTLSFPNRAIPQRARANVRAFCGIAQLPTSLWETRGTSTFHWNAAKVPRPPPLQPRT